MAYNKQGLYREAKPYREIKTIKGRQYVYERTVVTNGGAITRRSKYIGPIGKIK